MQAQVIYMSMSLRRYRRDGPFKDNPLVLLLNRIMDIAYENTAGSPIMIAANQAFPGSLSPTLATPLHPCRSERHGRISPKKGTMHSLWDASDALLTLLCQMPSHPCAGVLRSDIMSARENKPQMEVLTS